MKLNELHDNPNASRNRTRVGRGIGSGLGKTAGPVATRIWIIMEFV
jgi:large subunit ribosomal protein L15